MTASLDGCGWSRCHPSSTGLPGLRWSTGDPMFTPLLLALGIGALSLHPATMLEVRRAVRACDLSALRAATPALFRARDRAGIEAWLKAHGAH